MTRDARIVLSCGAEEFTTEQASFLKAEIGPDFHTVSIGEPGPLPALLLPREGPDAQATAATSRDAELRG